MRYTQLLNPFILYNKRDRLIPFLVRQRSKPLKAFATFHLLANSIGIPITANDRKLMSLKNIHEGKRAFIIGMGPSLHATDLDKLKGEITFACNKIYLAFGDTQWRPNYYTVLDILVAENNRDDINNVNSLKIFSSWVKPYFADLREIIWLRDLKDPIENGRQVFRFSPNALKGIYGGYTVIYSQLQLAFYMGIREIYLVGVDFAFNTPKPSGEVCAFGEVIESKGEQNHFHPNYRKPGERWTMPRLDMQYEAFVCASETYRSCGGAIYNASRRTELDVFPIVDFDSVLNTASPSFDAQNT